MGNRVGVYSITAVLAVMIGSLVGSAMVSAQDSDPAEGEFGNSHESGGFEPALPPPDPFTAADMERPLELSPPAGLSVESKVGPMTADEFFERASEEELKDPAPEGKLYGYGLTPDGEFGRTVECVEVGEPVPEIDPETFDPAEGSHIQQFECVSLFARE